MSEDQRKFIDVLKKQVIIWGVSYLLISVGILVAFYFNTNATVGNHDRRITKIESNIEKKASKEELNTVKFDLKDDVGDIKSDVKIIKEHLLNTH